MNDTESHSIIYNGYVQSLYILMGTKNAGEDGILRNFKKIDVSDIKWYVDRINKNLGEGTAVLINEKGDVKIPMGKTDLISTFVRQYIQHNARDVKLLPKKEVKELGGDLKNAFTINLSKDFNERNFITIKNGKDLYLYENIGGTTFRRINTLGTFGMNEYRIGVPVNTSLVKSNNINGFTAKEQLLKYSPKKLTLANNEEITAKASVPAEKELITIVKTNTKFHHVASMFLRYIDNDVMIHYSENIPEGYKGIYHPESDTIFIKDSLSKEDKQSAILEEVLHKLTTNELLKYISFIPNGKKLEVIFTEEGRNNPIIIKLANVYKAGYEAVYNSLAEKLGEEGANNLLETEFENIVKNSQEFSGQDIEFAYRIKDVDEFFAGMFFNPKFAEILNNTTYKATEKSITQNFIDAILRLFKELFPEMSLDENSVLQEAANVLVELLENIPKISSELEKLKSVVTQEMLKTDEMAKDLIDNTPLPVAEPFFDNPDKPVSYEDMDNNPAFWNQLQNIIEKKDVKLFNADDKELKRGSVVEYKGDKYILWNINKTGKAQLIKSDGSKYSGTPMLNKLTALGSYATTVYNNTEYIVTDNDNIYSTATGQAVYTGDDNSSKVQRENIIGQAKGKMDFKGSPYMSEEFEKEALNSQFNRELDSQINGVLPKGHIYNLGEPSNILLSAGIPNLPIEFASRILGDKTIQKEHPFEMETIKDLFKALQNPMAVFKSSTVEGRFVIMTDLVYQGKNFVTIIEPSRDADGRLVNDIRSIYPRENNKILNAINDNLATYIEKSKISTWLSKQQSNSAEVTLPNGNLNTKIDNNSETTKRKRRRIGEMSVNEVEFINSMSIARQKIDSFQNPSIRQSEFKGSPKSIDKGVTLLDIKNIEAIC